MNGEIGVESTVNEGSTFWLKLPFEKQSLRSGEEFDGRELENVRVLVVNPAPTSGRILHGQLAHLKMADAHAATGAEALEALRAAAAEGKPFELVIIDMDLAEMDG